MSNFKAILMTGSGVCLLRSICAHIDYRAPYLSTRSAPRRGLRSLFACGSPVESSRSELDESSGSEKAAGEVPPRSLR